MAAYKERVLNTRMQLSVWVAAALYYFTTLLPILYCRYSYLPLLRGYAVSY